MKNDSSLREQWLIVFMVCVLLPAAAGLWYRHHYELPAPQPSASSGILQTESREAGGLDSLACLTR